MIFIRILSHDIGCIITMSYFDEHYFPLYVMCISIGNKCVCCAKRFWQKKGFPLKVEIMVKMIYDEMLISCFIKVFFKIKNDVL